MACPTPKCCSARRTEQKTLYSQHFLNDHLLSVLPCTAVIDKHFVTRATVAVKRTMPDESHCGSHGKSAMLFLLLLLLLDLLPLHVHATPCLSSL